MRSIAVERAGADPNMLTGTRVRRGRRVNVAKAS